MSNAYSSFLITVSASRQIIVDLIKLYHNSLSIFGSVIFCALHLRIGDLSKDPFVTNKTKVKFLISWTSIS